MQTFASLQFFNYRLWFAGAFVSNVGTWMQRIAQDWLVLTVLTDNSGAAVGVVTGLQFLPFLVISPYAGLVADRVNPRKLLIATQAAAALLGLGLGALVLLGHVELWHVYCFALALGVVSAFDNPVRQTFVTNLVSGDNLANAVGLNSASFNAARLVGPAVAGLVIAGVGIGWVFVINGLTFIGTIAVLLAMRARELHPTERAPRRRGQVREGLRYVRRRTDLKIVLVTMAVVSGFALNFPLTSAMMASAEFDKGPTEYGVLGSILAIGAVTGSLLAARRGRPRLRTVVAAAGAVGVSLAVLAVMPTYETFALACIPVGFFALTLLTTANAWVQTTTAPSMRGRAMALYMMVHVGSTPLGAPIVGAVGEQIGPRWAIAVGAIAALLVAVGAAVWAIRHWDIELSYALHRPFVRVGYGRGPVEADRSSRELAAITLTEQQIEAARG